MSFSLAYYFFSVPIKHVVFFSRFKRLYGFFLRNIYVIVILHSYTFYRRVMKCCFLGMKNLLVYTTYKFFIPI